MLAKYDIYITNFNEEKFDLVKEHLKNDDIDKGWNFGSKEIYCLFHQKQPKFLPENFTFQEFTYSRESCTFLDENMYNVINMKILYRDRKLKRILNTY